MHRVKRLEIRVLVDNATADPRFLAEWGLSLYLRTEPQGVGVLFDFGQRGDVLMHNMRAAGVVASDPAVLVLSHGHYDHAGGLASILKERSDRPPLILHPHALLPKLSMKKGVLRSIGVPAPRSLLEERAALVEARSPLEVAEGVLFLGEVARAGHPEPRGGMYTVADGAVVEDPVLDDTGLAVNVEGLGLVIVTGCGHAGVLNIVEHAVQVAGGVKPYAVVGGLHGLDLSLDEARRVVDGLSKLGVEVLAPLHCSGPTLTLAAGERGMLVSAGAGSVIVAEEGGVRVL